MGVGASNLSTSDLSVYQAAITKISEDLNNSATNSNSIDLQINQQISFTNGGFNGDIFGCDNTASRLAYINLCQHGIDTNTSTNTNTNLNTGCDYFLTVGAFTTSDLETCYSNCADNAIKLFPDCESVLTPELILAATPTINCNVSIENISMQSSSTTQATEANLNSNMSSQISNSFQSEIDKQINQTNKDLNFMQFNSSDERTAVSQSIQNDINNSISNSSQNISTTTQNGVQTINFTNQGIINCSGCGQQSVKQAPSKLMTTETFPTGVSDTGQCMLQLQNSNIQKAVTDQKANSALTSIFNNAVVNDLASQYQLAVAQTNTGINIADLIVALMVPIIIALLVAAFLVRQVMQSTKVIWIAVAILIVIGGIFAMILAVSCQFPPYNWPPSVCAHMNPTSTPKTTSTTTSTLQSQDSRCPTGFQCTYSSLAACNTATNNQCHPVTTVTPTLYCGSC